ncbi:MAG: hypothetical protein H5U01_16285 [Clostridia bacterium]|nr:hypothetical protein [Clostridia bacterium]
MAAFIRLRALRSPRSHNKAKATLAIQGNQASVSFSPSKVASGVGDITVIIRADHASDEWVF